MPDLGIRTAIVYALCTKCCHLAAQPVGMHTIMLHEERSCLRSSLHAQSIRYCWFLELRMNIRCRCKKKWEKSSDNSQHKQQFCSKQHSAASPDYHPGFPFMTIPEASFSLDKMKAWPMQQAYPHQVFKSDFSRFVLFFFFFFFYH
ncbi:hypothetical protein OPV22_000115 [Ensete ventricosum]|uniref:Uncharacterized protein n=1 Tax=Ensete ventricosum TaxID=4639 RepID=A0AAV8RPG2_ENSVE|nr:hypothetical protein OPV22_000115 [Ensete ventricosum]